MCNPCLQLVLIEEIEVCTDHMCKRLRALCIVNRLGEKPNIIMAEDIVSSGFVEVLVLCRSVQSVLGPKRVAQCRIVGFCSTVS